ncbi:hypothetical protein N2152v2_009946 [Parachlorella kessleri]
MLVLAGRLVSFELLRQSAIAGPQSQQAAAARSLRRHALPTGLRRAAETAAARQPRSGSDSSSPAQPCPLHACLLRYGITDLAAFSAPRHLALSQEEVSSNVDPKLAALAAELLRQIGVYIKRRPHSKTVQLRAAGKILAASPGATVRYLSRDSGKVQQLLQWLEGSLGVELEQLAGCSGVCNALMLSVEAAGAVCLLLQEQQVSAQQVAHMLLRQPTVFNHRAELISARLGALQQHLGLDAAAALQLVIARPRLLNGDIEASLPPLLRLLDGYMGEEGSGRRLVRAQPTVGALTVEPAERSIGSLAAIGCSQQRIQGMINKHPIILTLDLDSSLQQQKLGWIERVSPWTLDDFLSVPVYLTYSTCRLAARLALLRDCRLLLPPTPSLLAAPSSVTFMAAVRQRLARQGRELPWASWVEWEEAWLGTEEGREWGFPPLKD